MLRIYLDIQVVVVKNTREKVLNQSEKSNEKPNLVGCNEIL